MVLERFNRATSVNLSEFLGRHGSVMRNNGLCGVRAILASMALIWLTAIPALAQDSSSVRPPEGASSGSAPPPPPTNLMPEQSDSDIWRMIRQGESGVARAPQVSGGQMIQSEGELWRHFREGPYKTFTVLGFAGVIGALLLFFALRGRIAIAGGPAGVTIRRFAGIERFAHWLTAISFVVLAISGLNLVIGTNYIMPLIGKELFAQLTMWGKIAHNYLGFSFLIGIALMFVLWVWHNIPHPRDILWFLKGGGIVGMGHPSSAKFNAGQKIIFWVTILGGASLGMSGFALMFPGQFTFFADTAAQLNAWFGWQLPTELSSMQEQQLNQSWHGIVGLVMTAIIIAHIYIGSVGMQGAFAAMGRGKVDLNWAEEHHNLWVAKLRREGKAPERQVPAE